MRACTVYAMLLYESPICQTLNVDQWLLPGKIREGIWGNEEKFSLQTVKWKNYWFTPLTKEKGHNVFPQLSPMVQDEKEMTWHSSSPVARKASHKGLTILCPPLLCSAQLCQETCTNLERVSGENCFSHYGDKLTARLTFTLHPPSQTLQHSSRMGDIGKAIFNTSWMVH